MFQKLNDKEKRIISLIYGLDSPQGTFLSFAEVARILKIPISSVRQVSHIAFLKMMAFTKSNENAKKLELYLYR